MLVANIPCTNLENAAEVISGARSRALGAQNLPKMGLSNTAHRNFGHGASEKWKAGHLQQHGALVASLLWDVGELAHCSAPAWTARPCPTGQQREPQELFGLYLMIFLWDSTYRWDQPRFVSVMSFKEEKS